MKAKPRKESFQVFEHVGADKAYRRHGKIVYNHEMYTEALCRWRVIQQINGDETESFMARVLRKFALLFTLISLVLILVFDSSPIDVMRWIF